MKTLKPTLSALAVLCTISAPLEINAKEANPDCADELSARILRLRFALRNVSPENCRDAAERVKELMTLKPKYCTGLNDDELFATTMSRFRQEVETAFRECGGIKIDSDKTTKKPEKNVEAKPETKGIIPSAPKKPVDAIGVCLSDIDGRVEKLFEAITYADMRDCKGVRARVKKIKNFSQKPKSCEKIDEREIALSLTELRYGGAEAERSTRVALKNCKKEKNRKKRRVF